MNKRISFERAGNQRGAVLVVSLLLLLVMTLLGLGASQSTRLQERMAGNQRDLEVAMQGAEASLRSAEELLVPGRTVITCNAASRAATCEAYSMASLVDANGIALDLSKQADTWWNDWGRRYQFATNLSVNRDRAPDMINERVAEVRETLGRGSPYPTAVKEYYRATARSRGVTPTAQAVVQSTYSRITFE